MFRDHLGSRLNSLNYQRTHDEPSIDQPGTGGAANTWPLQSPKPIRAKPGFSQKPRRMIASPSSTKLRPSPVASDTGAVPLQASSIIAPASPPVGPEIVPLPSTSPGCRLQPLIVWCATICETVQY